MRPSTCLMVMLTSLGVGRVASAAEPMTVALRMDLDGAAADPEAVVAASSLVDNGDFTIGSQPDVCRPLGVTVVDDDASITAGRIQVTGTDCLGDTLIAEVAFDGNGSGSFDAVVTRGTASGAYFRSVTSVATDVLTGEDRNDTVALGYAGDCPTQYVAYGTRSGDAQGKKHVDPEGSVVRRQLITSGGSMSTTLTTVRGNGAFADVDVGDLLFLPLEHGVMEFQVTARASDDEVSVQPPVNVDAAGRGFRFKKRFVSSDPADGLWYPVGDLSSAAFLVDQDAEASTGGVVTTVTCRAGPAEVETHTATLDGAATAVHAIDLSNVAYEACRLGLRFGTGDDGDDVDERISVSFVGHDR